MSPFLADIAQGQVQQFDERLVSWERCPLTGQPTQAHIDGLDGIGRVNDLAYLRRIVEER